MQAETEPPEPEEKSRLEEIKEQYVNIVRLWF